MVERLGTLLNNYVDLQVNGYMGVDFNSPATTVDQFHLAAVAMQREGVRQALPTLITNSVESMSRCILNIHQACEQSDVCRQLFAGIHLEGPFLSPKAGYIGAHPPQHALASDISALDQLCSVADGIVKLVTLAPEVDSRGELTRYLTSRNIVVAAGHTDASLEDLERCIDAGLTLFTHLGNACPPEMNRHDNIIYRALRCSDRLRYTLIADGFHVPKILFENLLRWVPLDRLAVVSDAISAAGLGPGIYQLAGRVVSIGPDKAARDSSGKHFVGSACSMLDADRWLTQTLELTDDVRHKLLHENPSHWVKI